MYKKLIGVAVILAFLYVQLGSSLTCYECTSVSSCKSPSKVDCTVTSANNTVRNLQGYFPNTPNTTSQNFDCLLMAYNQSTTPVMELRGCIFQQTTYPCSQQIAPNYMGWSQTNCSICSGNLCNVGKNPAATFSSSVFTLFASVVGVLIAKTFVH